MFILFYLCSKLTKYGISHLCGKPLVTESDIRWGANAVSLCPHGIRLCESFLEMVSKEGARYLDFEYDMFFLPSPFLVFRSSISDWLSPDIKLLVLFKSRGLVNVTPYKAYQIILLFWGFEDTIVTVSLEVHIFRPMVL